MGLGPLRSRRKLFALSLPFCLFTVGLAVLCSLLASPAPASAAAGINQQINFQGRLYNAAGATVPDGFYNMQFKIYQDGDGLSVGDTTGSPAGTLKWTESWLNNNSQGVTVKNGFMSVQLGSITSFGASIDWNQDTIWLSLNIGNTNATCTPFASCGGDGEMVPMKRMSANAYALNALNANLLGGLSSAGFIQNTTSAVLQTSTSLAIQSAADANETAYLQSRTSQSAAVLSIKGGSSQTGDYLKIVDSSNNPKFKIDSSGNATLNGLMGIGGAATSGVQLKITPATTTTIALQVAGSGATSGTNIVQIDGNNSGGITYNGAGTTTATSGTSQTVSTGIFKSANTSGTQTDGLVVDRNGASGTTTNGINVTQTAGTLTNGLAFNGTIGTDINRASGTLSINGSNGIDFRTNGTSVANLSNNGSAWFRNSSNTANAFQIQASAGYNLFNVDTNSNYVINNGIVAPDNLLQNPSYEAGNSDTSSGWLTNASWNTVSGSSNARSGNKYYANTAQSNLTPNTVGVFLAQPGEQFYAEEYIKISAGADGTANLGVAWFDKNENYLSSSTITCPTATTSYAICAGKATAPAGAQYGGLAITVASRTTGTYYFDDAFVARITQQAPVLLQNAVNSATAFQVVTAAGNQILTVDTTGNQVILGKAGASGLTGKLVIQNSTNANAITIQSGVTTGSGYTLTLPTALGGSGDCLKDTTGAGILGFSACSNGVNTIGTFSNTSIANGGSISGTTLTFGAADQTNPGMVSTGDQTFGGNKTFQNTNAHGDSTTALSVNKSAAAGGTSVLDVDTTNGRVGVNNAAPGTELDVNGTSRTTSGAAQTAATGIFKSANTSATQTDGVLIDRSGAGGTTTNGLDITNTAGTLTNGLAFTGTIGTDINRGAGTLTMNGAGGINFQTNAATTLSLSASGAALFKNSADSATAFQVQNSAGSAMLNVDTSSRYVINNGVQAPNNMVQNPGFESGATTVSNGWTLGSGMVVTTDAANSRSGNKYLAYTNGASVFVSSTGGVLAKPGEVFYVESYVKKSVGADGTANITIAYADKDFTLIGSTDTVCTPSTSYTLCTGQGTAPASTAHVIFAFGVVSKTTGTYYLDDTFLSRVTQQAPQVLKNSANSAAAFQVQNSAGNQILTVDTSGNQVVLGKSSTVNGKVVFLNSTGAGTLTIQSGNTTGNITLTLPTTVGAATDCLQNDGTTAGTLTFATCGAKTVAYSATPTSTGGTISGNTLTLTAADGTNPGLVSTGTQTFGGDKTLTGNTTLAGTVTIQNATNSTSALNVKKSAGAGGASVLDVDTTNGRVGIGNAAPSYELDVTGSARFTTAMYSPLADTVSGGTSFGLGTNNATSVAIAKTGVTTTIGGVLAIQDGTNSAPGLAFNSQATLGIYKVAADTLGLTAPTGGSIVAVVNANKQVVLNASGAAVASGGCYNFSNTANDASAASTTGLCRDGSGTIGQRNGATAQTLSIYNTYTDASNYERANIGFSSNVFGIDTQAAGTGTLRAISIGGTNATTVSVGGVAATTVNIGATSGTATVQLNLGTNNTASSTTNVLIGAGSSAAGGTTAIQSKGNTTISTNGTTRATFDTSNGLYLGNGVTAATPNNFTLSGTGSSTTAVTGGVLSVQGGNATTGSANGGNLNLSGGTGVGTGVNGIVLIATPTFSTTINDANCYTSGALVAATCTIAASSVNGSSAVLVGFNTLGQSATLPDPTITTAGRVVYVTAANSSNDFTLIVNGGGTGNTIAMRQNTTATMIWNGADWTAAGASSSTTLQSAYDNTLQSAGGAELIVSKTSTTNGLTIRESSANPVNGTLVSVQTSSAAVLFSVNSNVTEYASNAGAETAGGTTTTFPANTWSANGSSTVSRYITAGNFIATGQASVSVATTTAANDGVKNKLSTTLTSNTTYNVSLTTRLSSGTFTDLNVYYSIDGTAASVACKNNQIVATSVWAKVNCSFVAPSSGITSGNSIFVRQTGSGTARTFYVDNLSVTIAADYNYATDGSVDDNTNFTTNWTTVGATVTRSTTVGNDASDSASVVTTAANQGVRNKLSINPLTSTLYRVTAYAASTTAGFSTFTARYSRDGGTNFAACADYNTQTVSSSVTAFTKITCYITTDSTAATSPYVYFTQTDATGRTFYVDTFSMTLNSSTTPNVQVGGGLYGGPTTLFTLDKGASAPIASNNDALLGSMYYDTTLGKLQCYEADGWGACGSSPDNIVTISPEYTNAVMHGTGVGTMTSDICSDSLNINDGSSSQPTICGTNETYNFYKWTSPQASAQTYSIYVTYQLPATFKTFASGQTSIMGRTDSASATAQYSVYRNDTVTGLTQCGSTVAISTGSVATWQTGIAAGAADPSTCSFAAGNSIVFKIDVTASSNANAYVGNLNFTFSNK